MENDATINFIDEKGMFPSAYEDDDDEYYDDISDLKASFNVLTANELKQIKKNIREIGGAGVLAYELFKTEPFVDARSKLFMNINVLKVYSRDKELTFRLTTDEMNSYIRKYHIENYEVIETTQIPVSVSEYFKRNYSIRKRYMDKIKNAFPYSGVCTKNTPILISLLTKLSVNRLKAKNSAILRMKGLCVDIKTLPTIDSKKKARKAMTINKLNDIFR